MPDRTCTIDGCTTHVHCRGLCGAHYTRLRLHGDPLAGGPTRGHAIAFVKQAAASETDECIEWPYARTPDGYGQVVYQGKTYKPHRLALIFASGPPSAPGLDAAHAPVLCHNRLCVNPRHLRWATKAEQSADMVADGTRANQRRARLTPEAVRQIRADARPAREIAEEHGIAPGYVSQIKHRTTWAHLD